MGIKGMVDRRPPRMFAKMEPKQRDSLLRTIVFLGEYGFHAKTIAKAAGIPVGQVYSVCAKFQIKLRDYRDGKGDVAERVIFRSPYLAVKKINWKDVLAQETGID